MARATFGRNGRKILDAESTVDTTPREIEQSDDELSAGDDGTVESVAGNGDGETSGEVANDLGPAGETYTDPATAKPKRKPGRPKGTRGTYTKRQSAEKSTASAQILTANLEKVLFNLHKMGAGFLNEPALELSKDESALLAEAVKEVATAYDFTVLLNPRTQAWVDLGIACTVVYGGRLHLLTRKRPTPKIVTIDSHPQHDASANNAE